MSNIYVLDSCAIIAFLYGEQGKDMVKDFLNGFLMILRLKFYTK
jgi:PIN domain nuclease of toxin-antitoxin system